jgi:hypothetical protein
VQVAALTITPATGYSANYGGVSNNTSATARFVVKNTGSAASAAITLAISAGTPFTILTPGAGDCVNRMTTLASGASCTVQVQFLPTTRGAAAATLSASATSASTGSLNLSGTGLAPAGLSWTPLSGAFGLTPVGTGKTMTFTLTNTGDEATPAISFSTFADTGSFDLVWLTGGCVDGDSLAAGASCDVQVKAMPPGSGGSMNGTLEASFWVTVSQRLAADATLTANGVFN